MLSANQAISADTAFNAKVELWKQVQQMVVEVEQRNFSEFLMGTVISWIITVISHDPEKSEGIIFVPLVMIFALFVVTFNNKTSAFLRGYLSGIEDEINVNIEEELFLWNKKYHHLRNYKYFMTNTLSFAQYAVSSLVVIGYSFIKMTCMVLSEDCLPMKIVYGVLLVLYLLFVIFFTVVFSKEQLNNGDSKIFARIYFHIHSKSSFTQIGLELNSPDEINNSKWKEMEDLYNEYESHNNTKEFQKKSLLKEVKAFFIQNKSK